MRNFYLHWERRLLLRLSCDCNVHLWTLKTGSGNLEQATAALISKTSFGKSKMKSLVYLLLSSIIQAVWRHAANQLNIYPWKLDEPIWTIGSSLCAKWKCGRCPVDDLCNKVKEFGGSPKPFSFSTSLLNVLAFMLFTVEILKKIANALGRTK